ncbi:hypothetical protein MSIMFI_00061 [Mycobacterium simulans]|uniref:hypothetical protein n=1 Tax=Mycobacterium simulans TaxID=627089 RepID=UPI00174AC130|nr:hypothetical protein [Mycobacterium simulans]SON58583.1 hypothetical protein MSIMFI_00061 [Mycobacterium simulans]
MKTKVVVVSIGGMVGLMLLLHYFTLSRSGMPSGWMLYLGLPITAAGVLSALRLIQLGEGWGPATGAGSSSISERLRDLETLHGSGAISDTEYAARRLHIISEG